MKQSSALPITSPKNIPISRKQQLRNHHTSVAIFVSVEEPEDSHEGWKARFLICVQFWSNLNNYCGFVSFLISHKQLLRKISGRNTATWSSRNYIPESSYSFETGLLLCRKISKALPLGKMRTWENFVQPFSCLFPSPFVYPHLSISLPSCHHCCQWTILVGHQLMQLDSSLSFSQVSSAVTLVHPVTPPSNPLNSQHEASVYKVM